MYDDLYCKIFIDTNMNYDDLFLKIMNFVKGKKQEVSYISTGWCDISIQRNKEYSTEQYLFDPDDFLYWKFYLDVECMNIDEQEYIKKISDLLIYLKKYCNGVIAACDFENELNMERDNLSE